MRNLLSVLLLVLPVLAACAGRSAEPAVSADDAHIHAVAREHVGDTPVANAATRDPARPVVAEEVVYGTVDGRQLRGYLARPEGAPANAALPAVVVIHEWWGLNDNIRMMTRRLAGEGYTALAVDMFGEVAEVPERARELSQGASRNPEAALANLQQAVGYLQRERGAERIATIGWCFGGGWSLRASLAMPAQVDATVIYYGQLVTDREQLRRLDSPVLGIFGAEDRAPSVAQVREFEAALRELGKEHTIRVYEGAGHAFSNPSGQNYRPEAAEDAWQHTVQFLSRHLRREGR